MHAFSLLSIPLILSAPAQPADATGNVWRVYIGTYTQNGSEGIYLLELDPQSGSLEQRGLAVKTQHPSFLALHPTLPVLYAVGEMSDADGPGGSVTAFRIDPATGLLSEINHESSMGEGPCHITVAPGGRHVAVANYTGGSVTLLPLSEDGSLRTGGQLVQHTGSSINPDRQAEPHAHSVNFDKQGNFLFAADLGIDRVLVYRYDADANALRPNDPAFAAVDPGAGPRHFAFHPSGRFAYVVNELANTVSVFAYDPAGGTLGIIQTIGTLPEDFNAENTTAEIRVHPSGKFLYASNRGHDSIAAFAIEPDTGKLSALGQTATGGQIPRNFNIDPDGQYLVAANQQSGNVVLFRIDQSTGALEPTGSTVQIASPVCVTFVKP